MKRFTPSWESVRPTLKAHVGHELPLASGSFYEDCSVKRRDSRRHLRMTYE